MSLPIFVAEVNPEHHHADWGGKYVRRGGGYTNDLQEAQVTGARSTGRLKNHVKKGWLTLHEIKVVRLDGKE